MAERKVLIIDDDEALAPMLNTAFKRYSFKVLNTQDGAEGLEIARREKPDLVLLAVELPVGNGFLVCKEFKQDPALKDIPIIVTSRKATDSDFDKHRKLKVRADDYLHKPFTDEELFQKVGNVVGFSLSPDEFSELEAKVHDFLEERGKLESEISEKADRISQLEEELAKARGAASSSKSDVAALKAKDQQIADLETELEGLQERAEESVALQSRVTELEDQLSEKEAMFSGEISGLQEKNNKLGKQVAALMESKDKAEASLAEGQASIEALESDTGVSFEELGENIRAWKEAADSLGEVSEGSEKLTRQVDTLQAQVEALKDEIEALKEAEEKLELAQASLEEAQTRASDAESSAAELQRTVEREAKKRAKLKEVLEKALAAIE